ncbi:MAG: hypothetical protein AAGJ31_05920 [Verrucomicrobiota bacterium]
MRDTLPTPRPWRVVLLLALLLSRAHSEHLLNGDFEDPGERGWTYVGENDGSHGVFSDPAKVTNHAYLFQLSGSSNGFSTLSQPLNLLPEKVYELAFHVRSTTSRTEPPSAARLVIGL